MLRGGQIPRSGRYLLDAAGRLHRWRPRSRVDAVAAVTVRARRMRVTPMPIEICGVPDPSFDLDRAFHELVAFEVPAPGAVAAPDAIPGDLFAAGAAPADPTPPAPIADDVRPLIDLPGVGVIAEPVAPIAAPPRPRHTPPPKISLKGAPSSMEQAAERWRGAR